MGNHKSTAESRLQEKWDKKKVQSFLVKGHRNKIFGCDVIIPSAMNSKELWVASCSADGKLLINEVFLETVEQKNQRQKALSKHSKKSKSLHLKSKSFSNLSSSSSALSSGAITSHKKSRSKGFGDWKFKDKTKKVTKYEIETNRLLSISTDSNICYTVSLHPNCRYASTAIDRFLYIYELDFNMEAPIYNEVRIAKDYISSAYFVDGKHMIFTSGDGNVYIYDFKNKKLISQIANEHNKKENGNNDILCSAHGAMRLDKYSYIFDKKHIVCYGSGASIFIYDITDIIEGDASSEENEQNGDDDDGDGDDCKNEFEQKKAVLLQELVGHFACDISSIAISSNAEFIAAASDDCTYNLYYRTVMERAQNDDGSHELDIEYVLLDKYTLENDSAISKIAWFDANTIIACGDSGKNLYLNAIFDARERQDIRDIVVFVYNKRIPKVTTAKYDNKSHELNDIIDDLTDEILSFVGWYTVKHELNVDFEGKISCIATCPQVNDGKGIIVVGGFSKVLQCFLPL